MKSIMMGELFNRKEDSHSNAAIQHVRVSHNLLAAVKRFTTENWLRNSLLLFQASKRFKQFGFRFRSERMLAHDSFLLLSYFT